YNCSSQVYTKCPIHIIREDNMATKRKTAEQAELAPETPTAAIPSDSGQAARATAASFPTVRQPGDEPEQSWVKRASIIVDPELGVKFHVHYENHQAIITFNEKPSPELVAVVRPILNDGGFEWDKVNNDGWKIKIRFKQREDDRREAKKTFYAVTNAIREHK